MNFSLRCVGFGEFEYDFHNIDPELPASRVLGYFLHHLTTQPDRVNKCYPRDNPRAFTANFFSSHPVLIYNEGRDYHSLGRLDEVAAGPGGMDWAAMSEYGGGGLSGMTMGSQQSRGAATTVRELFSVLADGTAKGQVGWVYFKNTRQTVNIVDKLSIHAHDRSQRSSTISVAATDLILATIADVKLELTQRVDAQVGEMMLLAHDWSGLDADLPNDSLLFPWLCEEGHATFKLTRREGLLVNVKVGRRSIALSRFRMGGKVADVKARLRHGFNVVVAAFEVEEGTCEGCIVEESARLMDLTPDGKTVKLIALLELPPPMASPTAVEQRTQSSSEIQPRAAPPPLDDSGVVVRIAFDTRAEPVEITLPQDGHFTTADLRDFLLNEELVPYGTSPRTVHIYSGHSELDPQLPLVDLVPPQVPSGGGGSGQAILHLQVKLS